jgi:hypothetical protein
MYAWPTGFKIFSLPCERKKKYIKSVCFFFESNVVSLVGPISPLQYRFMASFRNNFQDHSKLSESRNKLPEEDYCKDSSRDTIPLISPFVRSVYVYLVIMSKDVGCVCLQCELLRARQCMKSARNSAQAKRSRKGRRLLGGGGGGGGGGVGGGGRKGCLTSSVLSSAYFQQTLVYILHN